MDNFQEPAKTPVDLKTLNDYLFIALEKLCAQGQPCGAFLSHYALIFSFVEITWGDKTEYRGQKVVLGQADFLAKTEAQRVQLLDRIATEAIGQVFLTHRSRKT